MYRTTFSEKEIADAGLVITPADFSEALSKLRSELSDNIGAPKVCLIIRTLYPL